VKATPAHILKKITKFICPALLRDSKINSLEKNAEKKGTPQSLIFVKIIIA